MTQSSLLELARQGDQQALTTAINYLLQSKGLTASATLKAGCLQLVLQADTTPEQEQSVAYIRPRDAQRDCHCKARNGSLKESWQNWVVENDIVRLWVEANDDVRNNQHYCSRN